MKNNTLIMKVTEDGFIWKLISVDQAEKVFEHLPIYRLYEDDSEALCEFWTDIVPDGVYALEVGYVSTEDKSKILRSILIH
jgi:hypothetical protein